MKIATEIRSQLDQFGYVKVWSWGAHDYTGGDNFLEFKVQGFKLRGYVRITLNFMDLYDIIFKNNKGETIKEIKFVHALDMVDIIDNEVETDNGKYT